MIEATEVTEQVIYDRLALALLAVNSCTIDDVLELEEALRGQSLLNASFVAQVDNVEATSRLIASGYPRPTWILAERLQELSYYQTDHGLQQVVANLLTDQRTKVELELLKIRGIGPKVVRNFWALCERSATAEQGQGK